jgi:adenylate cyclase
VPIGIESSPHEFKATEEYRQSLIVHILETTRTRMRRHLADPACPIDFPVLAEFRAEGLTDYLATPLYFTDDSVHVATWCTRQPGGFTEAQLAGLDALTQPLARAVEIRMLRFRANNLLNTYVGRHAGARVLAGHIRRGDTEAIDAVIWLSDMRGFTARADRMAPAALIDLLNRYFDCQVPAIAARGGEVLKYMGDALLAIFPIAKDADSKAAGAICRDALAAARDARDRIAALETHPGNEPVRFGLALHRGEVLYGNIGSGARLDFTCIGPAVNLAARMEKLAGALGRTIVGSSEFAQHCGDAMTPVGAFALPGFSFHQAVYGLAEEA